MVALPDSLRADGLTVDSTGRTSSRRSHWLVAHVPAWFLRDVLAPFALTRLVLVGLGVAVSSGDLLHAATGWDGGWYVDIAQHGYTSQPNDAGQLNTAFAPLLPLLMHLLVSVLGMPTSDFALRVAGLLAVNASLLVALGYLAALVRLDLDASTARRAVLYALVFPSTVFLSALYPHALFLAAGIASIYYARRGRWWLAAGLGALTGLARVQGSLIALPLAYEYLAQHGYSWRRFRGDCLALLLAPLGGLAFASYLWLQVGDPLSMMHAQAGWARQFSLPWDTFLAYVNQPLTPHGGSRSPLDLAFALLLVALVIVSWARVRRSLALFGTSFLLVTLSAGQLMSSVRLGLELFPIYIVLAVSGRYRVFHYAYLGVASYLALKFAAQFAQGTWVA